MIEANYRLLQYLVAAAVGIAIVAPQIVHFMQNRSTLSGTNHIPATFSVSDLDRDDIVCQPDQKIPANTNSISADVELAGGKRTRVEMSVKKMGHVERSIQNAYKSGDIKFPFKGNRSEVVRSVCLRSLDERIAISGTGVPYPNLAKSEKIEATLNGKRVDYYIALQYWEEKEKSIIGQLNEIGERASLFRPGMIGSWFYWILPIVMLCLWIMAIRILVMNREENENTDR